MNDANLDHIVLFKAATERRSFSVETIYFPSLNLVSYHIETIFEHSWSDDWNWYDGRFSGQSWLDGIGGLYLGMKEEGPNSPSDNMPPTDVASFIARLAKESKYEHLFLDSFSVIENGEGSRRADRYVRPSLAQAALLSLAGTRQELTRVMSPREFEVLVANALAAFDFSRVTLRRYSKDKGIDIFALMASGASEETVVVEVKHTSRPIGLAVLDRLNGVRDREDADRAMLVVSSHVTRGASRAYEAKRHYVASYTWRELSSLLKDTGDWHRSPHGLWSKKEEPAS